MRISDWSSDVCSSDLLAAAVAAGILGHIVDAAVIVAVVAINAIVGFVQEGKAERALNAIRGMIAPSATVIRDGARGPVPVAELVPGDIVLLEAGDRVTARSDEHTSELQSLMRNSDAVLCL